MGGLLSFIALIIAWLLGALLAKYNLKVLRENKPERLEARRAYKKLKNERLRKFYGLDKK